jgi:hypothetical protein
MTQGGDTGDSSPRCRVSYKQRPVSGVARCVKSNRTAKFPKASLQPRRILIIPQQHVSIAGLNSRHFEFADCCREGIRAPFEQSQLI